MVEQEDRGQRFMAAFLDSFDVVLDTEGGKSYIDIPSTGSAEVAEKSFIFLPEFLTFEFGFVIFSAPHELRKL